jgi:hypothetical protein
MEMLHLGRKTFFSIAPYALATTAVLLFGAIFPSQKAYAITAPDGGSSFETAETLTAGEYSTTPIPESTDFYYSLEVPLGYELKIEYQYTEDTYVGTTTVYSSSQEELVASDAASGTLQWLNGNNAIPETSYYLVMSNWFETDGFTLNMTLTERFDADGGKDAGDNFDKAVSLDYGTHEGYISSFIYSPDGGNDSLDFYKLSVESGDTVTFRVTPDGLNTAGLAIYDENRSELYFNEGVDLTPGEIVQTSVDIAEDGYIYAAVQWPLFNSGDAYIFKYTLLVTKNAVEDLGGTATGDEETDDGSTDENLILSNDGVGETALGGMSTGLKTLLIIGFLFVLFILFIAAIILVVKLLSRKSVKKIETPPTPTELKPSVPNTNTTSNDETKGKQVAPENVISPAPIDASVDTDKVSDDDSKVSITVHEGTKLEVNTVADEPKNGDDRKD